MTRLKVFISHSSKTDENDRIRDQVCNALQDDFIVLVDKRIKPSEEWFPCLYEYMDECHAAVILLSNDALQSDWVKAEAAVLCARRRSNANFKLILIPLDGLAFEEIDKQPFFKVISITDFQAIRDCHNTAEIITKMSEALLELKSSKPPATPFEIMTSQLQTILKLTEKKEPGEFLTAFGQGLGKINSDFKLESNNFGDALVRVLFRDPLKIFENLRLLFIELSLFINKSDANKILDIVKGYWVHPEAAFSLAKARTELQAVAINSMQVHDFSGECYARLAWPAPSPNRLVIANKDDRSFADIETTLLRHVPPKTHPDRLRRQFLERVTDPIVLVFPYPESDPVMGFPDMALLDEIKTNLKNVTVILSTGENFPEHLDYVKPLKPLLTQQQEDDQYHEYSSVNQYIDERLES